MDFLAHIHLADPKEKQAETQAPAQRCPQNRLANLTLVARINFEEKANKGEETRKMIKHVKRQKEGRLKGKNKSGFWNIRNSWVLHTHMLHVWNVYQHLP